MKRTTYTWASSRLRRAAAGLVSMVLVVGLAAPAVAAPPSNDEEISPKTAPKLPYTDKMDATEATETITDPPCRQGGTGTVWYQFTANNDVRLVAETFGSDYNTMLGAYEGKALSSSQVACNDDWRSRQSRISFNAKAGRTYNFVVSGLNPGLLVFNLRVAIPPKNDEIARATRVKVELPFKDRVDTTDATLNVRDPSCKGRARSVWYRYQRPEDWDPHRISISTRGSDYYTALSVYTGPRYGLNQIECEADDRRSKVRFPAEPGKTYWIMVSAAENSPGGSLQLTVANVSVPFRFDLDVKRTGRISKVTGATHVGGTLKCNKKAVASIGVHLRQTQPDGRVKSADDDKTLACGNKRNWTMSLLSDNRPFTEGSAGLWVTIEIEERDRKREIRKLIELKECERCM